MEVIFNKLIDEIYKQLNNPFMVFIRGSAKALIEIMSKNSNTEIQEKEFIFSEYTFAERFKLFSLWRAAIACSLVGLSLIYLMHNIVNKIVIWFMGGYYIRPEDILRTNVVWNLIGMYGIVIFIHSLLFLNFYRIFENQHSMYWPLTKYGRIAYYVNSVTLLVDLSYLRTQNQMEYTWFYIILSFGVTMYVLMSTVFNKHKEPLLCLTVHSDGSISDKSICRKEGKTSLMSVDGHETNLDLFNYKMMIGDYNNIIVFGSKGTEVFWNVKYISVCDHYRIEYDQHKKKWVRTKY